MISGSYHSSPMWTAVGWTMIHLLWAGLLFGLLGVASRWLLRRRSPEIRHGVAVALLAGFSLSPIALFVGLASPRPATVSIFATPTWVDAGRMAVATSQPAAFSSFELGATRVENPATTLGSVPSRLEAIVARLPLIWIVGSAVTSLALATGLAGAWRLRRRCRIVGEREACALAARLADSFGLVGRFRLGVAEAIASPMLVGIVRPLILLPPAALSGWPVEQLEMALLHELAHLRRHDNLVNLWQCVVESFLFFHPAAWWLSAWIRLERERCCDRVVVGRTGKARPYAEMLASLAGVTPRRAGLSALFAKPLTARIRTILDREETPMRLTLPEGFGLVGGTLLAGTMVLATFAGPAALPVEESTRDAKRTALRTLVREIAQLEADSPKIRSRRDTLVEVAHSQWKIGDRDGARETLQLADEALEAGGEPRTSFVALEARTRAAGILAEIGDTVAARSALDRLTADLKAMTRPENREAVRRSIAEYDPDEAGDADAAGGLLADFAYQIIWNRLELGDQAEARALIAWAIEVSKDLDGEARWERDCNFASLLARVGDRPAGIALARRVEEEARSLPIEKQSHALRLAALALALCGDLDRAFSIVSGLDDAGRKWTTEFILEGFRDHDPDEPFGWLVPSSLKILIGTMGTKVKGSVEDLQKLADHFRLMDDVKIRARSLSTIALLIAKAGRPREALAIAETIPALSKPDDETSDGFYDSVKPGTFALIAARMAKAGDAGATSAFTKSKEQADAISSPGERLIALIVLAEANIDAGEKAAAARFVREAVTVAMPLPEPRRSRGLVRLVALQTKIGSSDDALPWVESIRAYPSIEKAQSFLMLAHHHRKAGETAMARALAGRAAATMEVARPDGFVDGPVQDIGRGVARITFLDPDLELPESMLAFFRQDLAERAQGELDVAAAEQAARAKPETPEEGFVGGRGLSLGMLANTLATRGEIDEAIRIAKSIEAPRERLWAYQQIALTIPRGSGD